MALPVQTTARKEAQRSTPAVAATDRLYQKLARRIFDDLASGRYAIGDRLPAERELSIENGISRPAVREALIALEVQGLIEVRVGSGAYVVRLPGDKDRQGFDITAFELTEARLLFEGEAAALAATQITEAELVTLEDLVRQMDDENRQPGVSENADHDFHMQIARATRNTAIASTIEYYWRLRSTSPECALLHAKARTANVRPVVAEHSAILSALRARDPAAARLAMRAHLGAVIDHLLFATEEQAIEEARQSIASTRARFARATAL
jgi:GntR family transcriptional repressor for pyruvate dehydrogenase complex